MTVIDSIRDTEALKLTFIAEFDAPPTRVWGVWDDPRQLERWWGPPTWPATFERHDLVPGGRSRYYMTGPDGEQSPGWWTTVEVDAPHRLVIDDGFSTPDGEPDSSMPTMRMEVFFDGLDSGLRTRMTIVTTCATLDQLEKVVAMGMVQGMTEALGQIDAILAETAES